VVLRSRVRQLEKTMRNDLDYFTLADGSRHWFDPQEEIGSMFDFGAGCLKADYNREPRPAPPEILLAVTRAKDRRAALDRLYIGFLPIDADVLIEEGKLVPRSLIAGEEWIAP
jgi:hypothetical protein